MLWVPVTITEDHTPDLIWKFDDISALPASGTAHYVEGSYDGIANCIIVSRISP